MGGFDPGGAPLECTDQTGMMGLRWLFTELTQRAHAELLQQHGADDDGALDDELVLLLEVVDDEQVRDALEHEDTEDRADDGAAAAGQCGAADDAGGDRVEFV